MNSCIRVRVLFDTTPIPFPKQCWLLFDSGACRVVGDIAHLISERFGINGASGLQLYLDDFLLPMNEDAAIVRDNDRIQVRVLGYQRNAVPVSTSATPSVSTAVEADGASDSCNKDKQHKKRKREKDDPETEGAPVEHRAEHKKEATGSPSSTEKTPPGTKRKRKSKSNRSTTYETTEDMMSTTSEAKEGEDDVTPALPPPSKKKKKNKDLRTVATKTTAGSLHVRFHSGSDSESDTEQMAVTAKSKVGKKTMKGPQQDGPVVVTALKDSEVDQPQKPKQRKSRHKKLTPDTVVGGVDDVFTTKTSVYMLSDKGTREVEPVTREACSSSRVVIGQEQGKASEPIPSEQTQHPSAATSNRASDCVLQMGKRSYEALPDLRGPPRVGDHIAFKVLELSVNCTPEVSAYKEGRVLSVSVDTVQIELSKESTQLPGEISEDSALAKFSLPDSDQSEEDGEEKPPKLLQVEPIVDLPVHALLQPKLL